jgi:putative ABC transport system permease protein
VERRPARKQIVRPRVEREVDEEFAFHVDMRVRELIARGMAPDEARAEALRGFGDVGRVKVRLRRLGRRRDEATRRRQWWEDARQDLVFALRQLRRAPLFALMAILALALGIGANTAVFSVVDAVLLKPLPFANPGRLVFVGMESPQGRFVGMFPAGFEFLRGDAATLLDVAAFQVGMSTTYTGGDVPVPVRSRQVSASFFRLFGLHTILGRSFTPQEDAPHAGRFVVLTKGMWQERFHADPSIVGKSISLGGDPYTVVGVLDRFSFDDLGGTPDVFVPLQRDPNTRDQGYRILVGARMKPGVTLTQASAAVARSTRAFTTRFPNALPAEGRFAVMPMMDDLAPHARKELYVLLGRWRSCCSSPAPTWPICSSRAPGAARVRSPFVPRSVDPLGASCGRSSPRACCSHWRVEPSASFSASSASARCSL